MADALTYSLTTIADLLLVPADRREACMRDLLYALATNELAFGEHARAVLKLPVLWLDDDSPSCTIKANGETLLTLEVTKADAHG
jgi:hypothetical protein